MASELEHIRLANHNHDLLLKLLAMDGFPDWAATVAFYKAVHVVEGVFAADLRRDSTSHSNREETLKIPKFLDIHRNYTHLLNTSRIARYLESSGAGGTFSTFTDFMDNDGVKKLVRKRLYAVEQHSIRFLTADGKKALIKIEPGKF